VPEPVETHDPEGVDYGWVMQTTFVVTIVVGAPIVALIAWLVGVSLPTWAARAEFAVRVGAVVWFVVAVGVFLYARRMDDDSATEETASNPEN
jgi:membrane protein YdbS with pleckstrin-like domain